MRAPGIAALLAFSALGAAPVAPQQFYRCTSPDGKVTYQGVAEAFGLPFHEPSQFIA